MSSLVARRTVLVGAGHAAAFGSLAALLPQAIRAGEAAAPQRVCLTMLYPSGEGLAFDADAFKSRHLPLLKSSYGTAIERVELRMPPPPPPPPQLAEGEAAPPPPPTPPLLAAVSIWLGPNLGDFIAKAGAASKTIATDMATITKSAPMVQFDVVEGQGGDARATVAEGGVVVSQYFFAKEGGTWDGKYFGQTYAPKVLSSYGPEAIQRVEVVRGELAQGGGKPLVAGSINVYLKDAAAYDMAVGTEGVRALGAEAQQNTTLTPVAIVMTVRAAG